MNEIRSSSWIGYRLVGLLGALVVVGCVLVMVSATPAQAQTPCPGPAGTICLFKDDSPDPVNVGQTIRFTIEATPSTAGLGGGLVQVTDTLPEGTTITGVPTLQPFFFGSVFGPSIRCDDVSADRRTVTCPVALALFEPSFPQLLSYEVTVDAIPSRCGTFTNTATSTVGSPDNPGPSATEDFTVVGCPSPPPPDKAKKKHKKKNHHKQKNHHKKHRGGGGGGGISQG